MTSREALFDLYEATIVSVRDPEHGWTDPALVCAEAGAGAHVLTAWNPGLARPLRVVNEAANARLHAHLLRLGYRTWQADGATPDGQFHEPGFCVWGMTRQVAVRIGRDYGQFAVFEYDPHGVRSVISCVD